MKKAFFCILTFITMAHTPAFCQRRVSSDSAGVKNNIHTQRTFGKTLTFDHPIKELVIAGEMKILLMEDSVQMIWISGGKAVPDAVVIKLKKAKSKLKISTPMFAFALEKPLIVVSLPHLKRLKITDDALVKSFGTLHTGEFEIIVDGNGKVSLDLAGNTVTTRLRGGGTITVNGTFRQTTSQSTVDGWHYNRLEASSAGNTLKNTVELKNN